MAAFTAVSARRTLGSSSYTSPPEPAPAAPKRTDFSDDVRSYVQRCFDSHNAIPSVTMEQMQTRLRAVINKVAESGALNTTDWNSMLLPQQMIAEERSAAMTSPKPPVQQPLNHLKLTDGVPSPTNKENPRKRKSVEMTGEDNIASDNVEPLWRKVKTRNVLEDRVSFPTPAEAKEVKGRDRRQRKLLESSSRQDLSKSDTDLERRRQRFGHVASGSASPAPALRSNDIPMDDASRGPVVGTCMTLEKRYLRLTAPPKPETVRPQSVLEKTLDLLKAKWKQDNNYSYICDQFKSMRQDLTVQHIKNAFTVNVYETHAHIALQKGDLGEYNQCQTQLRALYKQRLGGRPAEFLAYRILYFIYTGNRTDMNDLLASITPADREVPAVKHALDVRSALALGNYHRFFRLYLSAPNMGPYLMDMFLARQRLAALANISKSYKPDVPLRFVTEELGFEDDRECAGFICDHNGEGLLEMQQGGVTFLSGKVGTLFETARAAAFRRVDIKGQV